MSATVSTRPAGPVNPTRQQLDELDVLLQRMLTLPVEKNDSEEAVTPPARGVRAAKAEVPGAESGSDLAVNTPDKSPSYQTDAEPESRTSAQPSSSPAPHPSSQSDDWIKLAASWEPSAQTWGPLADSWKQSARAAEIESPSPSTVEEPKSIRRDDAHFEPAMNRPEPAAAISSAVAPPRSSAIFMPAASPSRPRFDPAQSSEPEVVIPWHHWPLIAFNAVFDACLMPLGPLGRPFKSPAGRNFLGGVGILCLVASAGWLAADAFGWLAELHTWLSDWFGWTR